jgi:hypothetical protein
MTRIPPGTKAPLRSQLLRVLVMIVVLIISGIATEHAGVGIALGTMWVSVLSVYLACRFGNGVLTTTDVERVRAAEDHWRITFSAHIWRFADLLFLVARNASIAQGPDA